MPFYPSLIRRFTALSSVFSALSLGLFAQDITLRISCWEGYAPDAEVAKFEQAMTAKHGVAGISHASTRLIARVS